MLPFRPNRNEIPHRTLWPAPKEKASQAPDLACTSSTKSEDAHSEKLQEQEHEEDDSGETSDSVSVTTGTIDAPEEDGHSSGASEIEEVVYRSSSESCSGNEGGDEESEEGSDLSDFIHDDIALASTMISQVKDDFTSAFYDDEGFNRHPEQGPGAFDAIQVLRELREHQKLAAEVDKALLGTIESLKLWKDGFATFEDFLAELDGIFKGGFGGEQSVAGGETSGSGREGGSVASMSEEEYDERVGDRAYLKDFLEDQLDELKKDVVAIGITLGKGELERLVKGREEELVRLKIAADRDAALVVRRKRVRNV